jgi:hypothetical protein
MGGLYGGGKARGGKRLCLVIGWRVLRRRPVVTVSLGLLPALQIVPERLGAALFFGRLRRIWLHRSVFITTLAFPRRAWSDIGALSLL